MQIIKSIESRIYIIRGERVMLDFDLASLYEVETKVLNQAVKRNIKRFPDDFMFRLSPNEWHSMRSQIVTAYEETLNPSSQIVMINQNKRNTIITPFAFTEQGVAMLSGVLKSDKAINMNIAIMRVFVDVRKILLKQSNVNEQLTEIKERIGEHDVQLNELYDAMENLIDEKIAQLKWKDREKIGFKIKE
ncbi:ORF6N domain-containing protein [Pedobacter punctiformis]|uniref:ORF6N domain-containing protein n=1 Tax=Pedobacter punctiformis TaxID=3004097 RepID=A0ABT4L3D2_9SPHI|nr:ORF6N domain-containing protein [Pedobacter sp. HCMS5-2]MCZ4242427.1 ORF6N domain-containing protein [Pedobacter sp. HCMS5-2]